MTFRGDPQKIAGGLQPVAVEFQLGPHCKVHVRVKDRPKRWEVESMMEAASAQKGHVVTRTVVCHDAVELSQVVQKLLAQSAVEAAAPDIRW